MQAVYGENILDGGQNENLVICADLL